ncbi:MAG: hypothetical protein P8L80_04110, partial [Flavobacteriales bacterium]|nr:hypothetical protein [Flavobacteriales bacterium]
MNFFKVEKVQVPEEVAYEEEIVNLEIVYEIEPIVDSLPEVDVSIEIETELELDKTPILKTNLWRPDYDTCSVKNLAKEKKITGSNAAKQNLWTFFEKLNGLNSDAKLHVFHYGDSQIEGDRITGRIRSSWQKTWGGSGPGLIPAIQPVPALALRQ